MTLHVVFFVPEWRQDDFPTVGERWFQGFMCSGMVFARRGASRPLRLIYTPPNSRCGATSAFGAFLHTAGMTPELAARFSPEAVWGPLLFGAGIFSALATAPSKYEFIRWGEGGWKRRSTRSFGRQNPFCGRMDPESGFLKLEGSGCPAQQLGRGIAR